MVTYISMDLDQAKCLKIRKMYKILLKKLKKY